MSNDICRIDRVVKGQKVMDGAGVKLYRIMPSHELSDVDPFVLVDEFKSDDPNDYIAGFPMHPHRGIETITYMLNGSFTHRDSKGHEGQMGPGDVQWMTAGRGILHEEMPAMNDGKLWGFQLWLSLPRAQKMVPPRYQHLDSKEMPIVEGEGTKVRIISGKWGGKQGPAKNYVPSTYLDARIFENRTMEFDLGINANKFAYVHTGRVEFEDYVVNQGEVGVFEKGSKIKANGTGESNGFLLFSGIPNNEPIVRGGPFVMNTLEEIHQAFDDYRRGVLHL